MALSRRLPLKPPQLTPTVHPLSFEELKKGTKYPSNAVLWTEESIQALQRFLRDLHETMQGQPAGFTEIPPFDIRADNISDRGSPSVGWATGAHKHAVPTGMPVPIGVELPEQIGASPFLSRADHRHEVEQWRSFGITIDGATGVPVPGIKGYVACPYNGTIHHWAIEAEPAGSCVIDIWKARGIPDVADTICGGSKPTLSSGTTALGTPSGWTSTVALGDIFGYNLDSASTVTRITLMVVVRET